MSRLAAARIDLDSLGVDDCGNPIRIGAYQSVARTMLPLILQELGADSDEVEFDLKESSDDLVLLELLERGELDVAFTELPLPDGPLEATRLLDDPYVLIVPEEHEFALLDRPLTLEELAEAPLITFKCRTSTRDRPRRSRSTGCTARIARQVEDGGTLLALVHAGLGLGLVPRLAADIDGKPLVAIPVEAKLRAADRRDRVAPRPAPHVHRGPLHRPRGRRRGAARGLPDHGVRSTGSTLRVGG